MSNLQEKDNAAFKSGLQEHQDRIPADEKKWKWNIRKLYLFQFFVNFHLIAGVLVPFFTQWGKLSFFEIMCLESYFTVMILLFEIPCGAIADTIGRKFSLFLGGLSIIFAALIYSSYPNIFIFAIGETLWAFSQASISGTDQALVYDSLKKIGKEKKISQKMARIQSSLLIAIVISSPLGSILGDLISLPFVMFIMIVPFFIATLISLTVKEPNESIVKTHSKKYRSVINSGFNELKDSKMLRIFAFEYIYIDVIVFFLIWTYQPYLELLEIDLIYFGFVAASMTASQVLFTNIVPRLEQSITHKSLLIRLYTLIPGLLFILLGFTIIKWLGILLILLVIGMGFSRRIFFVEAINKEIKIDDRATVLSTINMFGSLLRAILYPIVGILVEWNLQYTFIILGAIIIMDSLLTRIKTKYFSSE